MYRKLSSLSSNVDCNRHNMYSSLQTFKIYTPQTKVHKKGIKYKVTPTESSTEKLKTMQQTINNQKETIESSKDEIIKLKTKLSDIENKIIQEQVRKIPKLCVMFAALFTKL